MSALVVYLFAALMIAIIMWDEPPVGNLMASAIAGLLWPVVLAVALYDMLRDRLTRPAWKP